MGAKGTDSFAPAWQNTGQVYGECPASPPQRLLCEITTRFLGKDKRTLYATRIDATPRISLNAFLMFLTKIIGKTFGGFRKKLYLCRVNEKGVMRRADSARWALVQTPNPLT